MLLKAHQMNSFFGNNNINTLSNNIFNNHETKKIRHNFIIETASYHTMIKPRFTEGGNLLVWTISTHKNCHCWRGLFPIFTNSLLQIENASEIYTTDTRTYLKVTKSRYYSHKLTVKINMKLTMKTPIMETP